MKALIADDEAVLAEHLRSRLAALWPQLEIVGIAANGIEAKEMIEGLRPDVAFLDIRMPGLTGLEVVQALSEEARRACRLVFVTAYDEFAVQAFEREAVDYLLKPVGDDRLRATVERLQRAAVAPSATQTDDMSCSACRRCCPKPGNTCAGCGHRSATTCGWWRWTRSATSRPPTNTRRYSPATPNS
jgi:DNA-binding LytR/AlgR family response regulator